MIKEAPWKLLKLRSLFLKNSLLRPTSDKCLRWLTIIIFTGLFVWGDYQFFIRIIQYLDGLPLQIGEELIVQLINVVFLTLFTMVLFSSIIAALAIYYVSADLDFLHSLPVDTGSLIQVRFVQTVFNASWMMFLFSMPIFVAYGRYFQVPPEYYIYLLVTFIPFLIVPCYLGVLGIMVLMRFFPTQRAYQTLSFLGLFFLAGLVILLRFLSPEKFFGQEVSDEMIIGFVESLRAPEFPLLPSSWITHGLTAWMAGDGETAMTRLVYLISAAIFLGVVFRLAGERLYFRGWQLYQEVRNTPGSQTIREGTGFFKQWLPLNTVWQALLLKDFRIFMRDPSQWSQLFILGALVIVYIFNIQNLPLSNIVLKNVISALNIGLIGFVLSALISRFVFPSTSMEGRRMWSIYTAPVNMRSFLMAKFWMYFPPLLIIGEFLVVASNHLLEVDPYVMKVSMVGVFLITLGLVGMGVGMGAMYPMFRHDNVSEISGGSGGVLFMITSLTYVGMVMILGARPMYVHFKEKFLMETVGGPDVFIVFGVIAALTLFVAVEPIRRGIRVLEDMDL